MPLPRFHAEVFAKRMFSIAAAAAEQVRKRSCAATFAVAGIVGAAIGSTLGKLVDGQELLFLFALAMIAVGVAMLRPRAAGGNPNVRLTPWIAARLIAVGLVIGAISGFFGIGGGFLIVPGLMLESGMPILNAIGSDSERSVMVSLRVDPNVLVEDMSSSRSDLAAVDASDWVLSIFSFKF